MSNKPVENMHYNMNGCKCSHGVQQLFDVGIKTIGNI